MITLHGAKMSKSRGNVVNPDLVVREYGADSLRMFEMFMGPLNDTKPWNTRGIVGVKRFLDRAWAVFMKISSENQNGKLSLANGKSRSIHKLVKDITNGIQAFELNTCISSFMKFFNGEENQPDWRPKLNSSEEWERVSETGLAIDLEAAEKFIILLSPFAPHLAQELWGQLGHSDQVHSQQWPTFDAAKVIAENVEVVVQINGKVRDKFTVVANTDDEALKSKALASDKIQKWLDGKAPKKVIVVKGKLVRIVV